MGKKGKKKAAGGGWGCAELSEWVCFYVEGEVSAEVRQQILLHIQTCRSCARLVRSLKRTVHYCQIEPGCEVPETAHHRLWQMLRRLLPPGQ